MKTISISSCCPNKWLKAKVVPTSNHHNSSSCNSSIEIPEIWSLEPPPSLLSSKMKITSQCLKTPMIWVLIRRKSMITWTRHVLIRWGSIFSWSKKGTEEGSWAGCLRSKHRKMSIWKKKMSHCSCNKGHLYGCYKKRTGCLSIVKIQERVLQGKGA